MQPKFRSENTFTEEDFRYLYQTNLLYSQGPKGAVILVVIATAVAIIAGIVAKNTEKSPTFAIVLALIVIAAFCAMILKNLTGEIRRIAAEQMAGHQEKHPDSPYTILSEIFEDRIETGLKDNTEGQKTEIPFSEIKKVIKTKKAMICTTQTGQSLFFKNDSFTLGTFEDFSAFLNEKRK